MPRTDQATARQAWLPTEATSSQARALASLPSYVLHRFLRGCDKLALRASEVAGQLEITVSVVNSLLHRARHAMRDRYERPAVSAAADPNLASPLRRCVHAWESGDVDLLLSILKADATLEMPPIPSASIGHAAIRAFLAGSVLDGTPGRWRGMTTEANGGPAVALYARDGDVHRFTGLQLLSDEGNAIARVTAYMDAALAAPFSLPPVLER